MPQPVKIAVDSPADVPPEWRAKLDIAVIPCYVNFGLESFLDDGRLTHQEFYRRLEKMTGLPTTAAPPADLAEGILLEHLKDAEHLVVFTVAKQLSSMYNSIRLAAEKIGVDRVTVIDSGSLTFGESWGAIAAAQVAARGGSKAEVIETAASVHQRTRLYPLLDTLEFLRRGGRVSQFQASMGALLQIKPILNIGGGKVETAQRVRTTSKGVQALVEMVRKEGELERVAILHSNAPQRAEELRGLIADLLPKDEDYRLYVGEITVAIGTHIGPGAVGVALVRKNP